MLGGKRVLYERFYSVCALIAQGSILRSRPYCAGARIAKEPPILSYGPFVRMFRPRCCPIIRCGFIFLSSAPHKLAEVRQSRNFSKFVRCTRHVFEPFGMVRVSALAAIDEPCLCPLTHRNHHSSGRGERVRQTCAHSARCVALRER